MSYQPTVEKDFYLVRDLCALLGIGKQTAYVGIEAGELPGYKVGGRYVIPGPAFRDLAEGKWVPLTMRLREDNRIEAGEPKERGPLLVDIREFRHMG